MVRLKIHSAPPPRKPPVRAAKPVTGARGAATRARIREAANHLFLEQGFEATTVDAIVEMGTSAERLEAAPYKLLRPLLEMGQARSQVRDDIPAEALAQFVLRSVLGALRDWGRSRDDLSRDDALNYAVTLVSDAVAP